MPPIEVKVALLWKTYRLGDSQADVYSSVIGIYGCVADLTVAIGACEALLAQGLLPDTGFSVEIVTVGGLPLSDATARDRAISCVRFYRYY